MSLHTVLAALLRRPLFAFVPVALVMAIASVGYVTEDHEWDYFAWGSDVLFGEHHGFSRGAFSTTADEPGGLHLYANYGFLQIGPPALLIARLIQIGPYDGAFLAIALVQLLGLLSVWLVARAFRDTAAPSTVLLAGLMTTLVWGGLTRYAHLDDALALAAVAAAVLALCRRRPALTGLLLGLAAAAKPWAVVAVALVAVLPAARDRARGAAVAAAVVCLFWAPFVLADRRTLSVGAFHLAASVDSPLATLGLAGAATMPGLRAAQFALGLLVALLVVLRGPWQAALVAGFATRLAVDPSSYSYYVAGAALTAMVADVGSPRRLPLLTGFAAIGWLVLEVTSGRAAGAAALTTYLLLIALALWSPHSGSGGPAERPAPT